jgi:hypothetical protein
MKKRIGDNVLSILLLIFIVIAATAGIKPAYVAVSADTLKTFDDTDITEDLKLLDYSEEKTEEKTQVAGLIEYGFAENAIDCGDYALYIYVYNPTGKEYSTRATANVVNIATEYDQDGEPSQYNNFPLTECAYTTDKSIYKYRIVDEDNVILQNARSQNKDEGQRRYDIASVQLWTAGDSDVTDYYVAKTFYYEGYDEGLSTESAKASTLTVQNDRTVQLTIHPTYFRPDGTNGTENKQDTLASVFFTVPNSLIERYGSLYAVHAEYLKAVTAPALVTNNDAFFESLTALRFQDQSSLTYACVGTDSSYYYEELTHVQFYSNTIYNPSNMEYVYLNNDSNGIGKIDRVDIAFHSGETSPLDYTVTSEELTDYLKNNSENKDVLGRYDSRFFSSVDEEKTEVKINADEKYDLTSILFSGWWLFRTGHTAAEYNIPAIQKVTKVTSEAQIKQDYYVDTSCYEDFKAAYEEKDTTLYVFHFAKDDYFAEQGMLLREGVNYHANMGKVEFRQETVYLDFDILDLTLRDEKSKLTVVGVVADPVDVIPALTPSVKDAPDWLPYALATAGALVVILVIARLLKSNTENKK